MIAARAAPERRPAEPAAAGTPVVSVQGLRVSFPRYGQLPQQVLRGVDLDIPPGEVLGLVGESGAGKTTLARAVMGLVPPPGRIDAGRVLVAGRDVAAMGEEEARRIRGRLISMVIANPRGELDPLQPVGRQIANMVRYHLGVGRREARERALALLRDVSIPDPERRYDAYPHELSGGMAQRVVMAIALACEPAFVISDDATSGLDVTVQAQVLDLLRRLVAGHGMAMLFVTRDIGITAHFCDRIAIILAGEIVEVAGRDAFFADPAHPYTLLLLAAFSHNPKLRARWLGGGDAVTGPPETGCRFANRCVQARERCRAEAPALRELAPGHWARCHFPVRRGGA